MTSIPFTKAHGLGNDFVIVADAPDRDWSVLASRIADRRRGLGCDQLLVWSESKAADVRMSVYNPDGSRAEMCGNGIRALARLLWRSRPGTPDPLRIETDAGIRICCRRGDEVRVDMGLPRFGLEAVGADLNRFPSELWEPTADLRRGDWPVAGAEQALAVSVGNPHLVIFSAAADNVDIATVGPLLERDPAFPDRINVELVRAASDGLRVDVWERGAGVTQACGTGACAAAAAALATGMVAGEIKVDLPGGRLRIDWDGSANLWMTGPAVLVADGDLHSETLTA